MNAGSGNTVEVIEMADEKIQPLTEVERSNLMALCVRRAMDDLGCTEQQAVMLLGEAVDGGRLWWRAAQDIAAIMVDREIPVVAAPRWWLRNPVPLGPDMVV
jgi:hypothetical protein